MNYLNANYVDSELVYKEKCIHYSSTVCVTTVIFNAHLIATSSFILCSSSRTNVPQPCATELLAAYPTAEYMAWPVLGNMMYRVDALYVYIFTCVVKSSHLRLAVKVSLMFSGQQEDCKQCTHILPQWWDATFLTTLLYPLKIPCKLVCSQLSGFEFVLFKSQTYQFSIMTQLLKFW